MPRKTTTTDEPAKCPACDKAYAETGRVDGKTIMQCPMCRKTPDRGTRSAAQAKPQLSTEELQEARKRKAQREADWRRDISTR